MVVSGMIGDESPHGGARRGLRLLAFAYVFVFTALIVLGAAVAFLGNPHAGEPYVRLDVALMHPARAAAVHIPPPAAPASDAASAPDNTAALPDAGSAPTAPEPVPVPAGHALVLDPALIEKTSQGSLPRIADDGTTPMRAYAAPAISAGKPRIAIVISGLGISAKATQMALDKLPAGVTVAFAPYAADVQRWVTNARQRGHEVLLEVPMEPYDFPDSDPGKYTLRAGQGEEANTQRLVWALTRFTGYTGVTNLLGGRLLSDPGALEPVLTYLTRRGLLFFDNGLAVHSVAPDVAIRVGAPFAQANETIDSIQAAMEIDHHLSDLETVARAKGSASGSGFLYPITIERVSSWAKGLQGRGFVLVPVSAIVSQSKQ